MPQCFYSFFNFCKSVNNEAEKALSFCGLKLVGPYDVLLGIHSFYFSPFMNSIFFSDSKINFFSIYCNMYNW